MMCVPRVSARPLVLSVFLWLAAAGVASADEVMPCMPFAGERMLFNVGWEFINAGVADMRIEADAAGYRVISRGKSNKLLDLFHKVRDTIISAGVCRNGKLQSERFDVEQHEGHYQSSKQVRFLWQENAATHTQNGKTDRYAVPAGHLDAIDAFFRVRKAHLEPGMKLRIPIFDSRKKYDVLVEVKKRAKLRAPWGKAINCLLIIPRLKTRGIFSSKGKVKIWLTDDARHIPLKVTARVKIGRIVAKLSQYQSGE